LTIYMSNIAGVLSETETVYPSRAHGFLVGSVLLIFLEFSVLCFLFCLSSSCVMCTQCCQCHWVFIPDCPNGFL